ncbi:aldehyde dehydrogenase domain-containing protein [Zopfochytrium polystomum]|nr:aldehyde dehydrogenase domain-containing protein [Zopfochytrium polystomum]
MAANTTFDRSTHVKVQYQGRTFELPTGLFINNTFVPSIAGKKFATHDPASGKVLCEVYEAFKEDVDVAVAAAHKGFEVWSAYEPRQRAVIINRFADLMEKNLNLLAEIESMDNGKPVTLATAVDLNGTINCYRYQAGWADKHLDGKVVDIGSADRFAYTRAEPYGVCGLIVPWNFPLNIAAWKLAPALAMGNAVVLKTSEKTPLSMLKICELIVEAGFPPGVVNVLSGYGPTAGDAIARHMEISKVSFTGSTATGRKILIAAAESNLKKVSLELGGKSPSIVFDDADMDRAVAAAVMGFTFNQGQVCCGGTRLFVQEGIYDAFVAKLRGAVAALQVGHGFEATSHMGPLVDKLQFDRVLSYIKHGQDEGATLLHGGSQVGKEGYLVEPTVFTDVKDDMKIAREEIFGPVVVVMKFKTVEEVVRRANDTPYGLAASVHTKSLKTAHQVAHKLQAGTVWVNTHNMVEVQTPFGGYKQSGVGRENGEYALREYTQIKAVLMDL